MSRSTVFTNNRLQTVRLPADARLPPHVKRVVVRVRWAERIISSAATNLGHRFRGQRASDQ